MVDQQNLRVMDDEDSDGKINLFVDVGRTKDFGVTRLKVTPWLQLDVNRLQPIMVGPRQTL